MLVGVPMQLVLGRDIRLLCRRVVARDWCGAGGLAQLAEQWPGWIFGAV